MKFAELKEKIKNDIGKTIKVKKLKKIINNITPSEFKKDGQKNTLYNLIIKKLRS